MFATTRWSLVLAAGDSGDLGAREALSALCETYWPPVFLYVRSRGHDAETARDLTQGFFTLVLEKGYLRDARQERGRFRSFLLSAAKHFLANEWDREQAQKRGGGAVALSLDLDTADRECPVQAVDEETPERAFERRWALTVLAQVLDRLEGEMERSDNRERFARLRPYLTGDASVSYKQLASELEMSESAVKVAIHRLRRRFGDLLREEVQQTVGSPEEVEAEIRHLFSVL